MPWAAKWGQIAALFPIATERIFMPRKPNYKFDRMERERAKAAKKAARQEAKREKAEERKIAESGPEAGAEARPGPEAEPEAN